VFTEKLRALLFLDATMVSCSIGLTLDQILDRSPAGCNSWYHADRVFGSLQELVFPVPKKKKDLRTIATEWKGGGRSSDKTIRKERRIRRAEKKKSKQPESEEIRLARLARLQNIHVRRGKVKQPPTRKRARAPFPENTNSSLRLKAHFPPIPEVEVSKENQNPDSVDPPGLKFMLKKAVFRGIEQIKKVQLSPMPENAESIENPGDDRHLAMADPALKDLAFIPSIEDDDLTYKVKNGSGHPLIAGFLENITPRAKAE
jgi:hypothetical protein